MPDGVMIIGEPWNSGEEAHLKTLFDAGLSDAVISIRMDRTEQAIRVRRQRLGLRRAAKPSTETWTDERLAMLTAAWGTVRAAEIADELNAELPIEGYTFTKAAVVGKANRIGLKKLQRAARGTGRPRKNPPPPEPVPQPDAMGIALPDLMRKHCRYPFGEGIETRFCGNNRRDGSSYCEFHHAKCTIKTERRPASAYAPLVGRPMRVVGGRVVPA